MSNIYNSKFAKFIGSFSKSKNFAITINQTTYYSCSKELVDDKWRCHEDRHKDQWKEMGTTSFVIAYFWYLFRYGYENNPLEINARNRANDYLLPGYLPKED